MKKFAIIVLLLITITIMCSFLNFLFGGSISPRRKVINKIMEKITLDFKRKYDLHFVGFDVAAPDGTYNSIGPLFHYRHDLNKDQGRVLLLNCVEDLLIIFNNTPEFKKYMTNSVFTNKNVEVTIFVRSPELGDIYYPDIAVFSFVNNTLCYDTNSPEKKSWYYTEEEESYEEAKQIIAKQQSKVIGN